MMPSSEVQPPLRPQAIVGKDKRYNRVYEIPVLYHSVDYLIVSKPCNLRIDGDTETAPTLEADLKRAFPEHSKIFLMHQLDHVTSGIHCWGLSRKAAGKVGKLFEKRLIQKTYVALVKGHVPLDIEEWTVDKPIAKDLLRDRFCKVGTPEDEDSKPSLTHVQIGKRGFHRQVPCTHVIVFPKTGRKHQIRVHLASMGFPILGDVDYDPTFTETDTEYRTMLHAWKIVIPLPNEIRLETPDPFLELLSDEPTAG